jgi:5-formyltetrahydrofolate cyclo-ligase
MTPDKLKAKLRNEIKVKKQAHLPDEIKWKSNIIFRKIEKLDIFIKAGVIMAYWSLNDEVDTHDFILKWYQLKTILLPVIKGDTLGIRKFTDPELLTEKSRLSIMEPVGCEFASDKPIDLILVPGLAFDLRKNRLGRGKAYYDKFLMNQHGFKMGICFDFQLLKEIPITEYDIPMDQVITNID